MKKRNQEDALDIMAGFQNDILRQNLNLESMYQEVRMMRFKIRPLVGNVLALDLKDKSFIQALWSLGKLDEFFHKHYHLFDSQQRKLFFDMFDRLHSRFEGELNKLNIAKPLQKDEDIKESEEFGVELEIFKEYPTKKKLH